ncbi:MAG: hypothetical protein ABI759_17055 [Candidatus Solibacter sp.]
MRKALAWCLALGALAVTLAAQDNVNQGSLTLQDFSKRVAAYVKINRAAASKIPSLKRTGTPEAIAIHERKLASAIRRARPNAAQGEVFTPEIATRFRELIAEAMRGSSAERIHESLRQAAPVWLSTMRVNMTYPHEVPLQSSPPTLLANLPQLPAQVEYRFVGNSLILRDLEANLIVDFIRDAIR